jgi:hypothetical protein
MSYIKTRILPLLFPGHDIYLEDGNSDVSRNVQRTSAKDPAQAFKAVLHSDKDFKILDGTIFCDIMPCS